MENIQLPLFISCELAEETGWHIGDGSMNFYNNKGVKKGLYQLRGHRINDKNLYLKRIKPFFKKLYNINISLRDMPSTEVFGFQIWSNKLVNFKKALGLQLGKKTTIKIPQLFFKKKKFMIAVIRGIFDTDGCVYLLRKNKKLYPILEIHTISMRLAKQMRSIFKLLGFTATEYVYYPKKGNRLPCSGITIRGVKQFHRFMRIIKPQNENHVKKYEFYANLYK